MPASVAAFKRAASAMPALNARRLLSVAVRHGPRAALAFPLLFVVASWLAGAGFPFYFDNNETFLSYVHARNLEIWDPWEYGWLTAEATDPARDTVEKIYAHNPNAPRYLHYLLLSAGVRELSQHVLILGLLGTGLSVALLLRAFSHPTLLVVPLAVVLDYTGFLAWTVNTYRVWTFVLYVGLILAVTRDRPRWVGILTFCLFQVEYGMALFMGVTTTLLAVLTYGWQSRTTIVAAALGAVVSLAVFGAQVLAYYGWEGFVHELAVTYARRGTDGAEMGLGAYARQAWDGTVLLIGQIGFDTYNRAVLVIWIASVVLSLRTLGRGDATEPRRFLARLTVATLGGTVVTSALLYGYFVDGFVHSRLPLAVFLVAPAIGVVAVELRVLVGARSSSPLLGPLCSGVALLPLVAASISQYRPPVAVEMFRLLQTEYRGKAVVAPNLGPALSGPELAFALTGGRAFRTGDVDVTSEDLRHLEPLRDADGTLTYVCLDTLYLRWTTKLGAVNVCDLAVSRMVPRGHDVLAEGIGWTIMRVNREAALSDVGREVQSAAGAPVLGE